MKFFPAAFFSLANGKLSGRRNLRQLLKLVVTVLLFVALSSMVFHVLMEREGRGGGISVVRWNLLDDGNHDDPGLWRDYFPFGLG